MTRRARNAANPVPSPAAGRVAAFCLFFFFFCAGGHEAIDQPRAAGAMIPSVPPSRETNPMADRRPNRASPYDRRGQRLPVSSALWARRTLGLPVRRRRPPPPTIPAHFVFFTHITGGRCVILQAPPMPLRTQRCAGSCARCLGEARFGSSGRKSCGPETCSCSVCRPSERRDDDLSEEGCAPRGSRELLRPLPRPQPPLTLV